jgi:glycosyltransferase involved in cell wall biosynthesis
MTSRANDGPSVSICIPASRAADGLRAAVASVLAQDHDDLEVVITDDSGGALEPVAAGFGDDRVRYFANPGRLGLAGNHTAALARARGRYLGFLHDDDRFLPAYVSSMVAPFERDPSLGVVFSDCWIDRGIGPYGRRGLALTPGRHERFLPYVIRHDYLIPSTTMMRRDVWDDGPQTWPDLVVADVAMFVGAALAGWPFFYIDEPLVVYRKHEGQIGVAELRNREHVVALWDSYRFEDREAESARRAKLAHWLIACAGARLKQGDAAGARADLARANAIDARIDRPRRLALTLLARQPALVAPANRAWRRLRPRERTAPLNADSA